MAATKKPARKPMVPRKPSTGVRQPMPKIEGAKPGAKKLMPKVQGAKPGVRQPMAKSGLTVVLPNGSTVGLRDLGKVKPTPKPKPKVTPKKTSKMTPEDATMKKIIKKRYGW